MSFYGSASFGAISAAPRYFQGLRPAIFSLAPLGGERVADRPGEGSQAMRRKAPEDRTPSSGLRPPSPRRGEKEKQRSFAGVMPLNPRHFQGRRPWLFQRECSALVNALDCHGAPRLRMTRWRLNNLPATRHAERFPHSALTSTWPALISTRSALTSPRSALTSPRSALTSPHSALTSPHSALTSPRSALTSTRSALASPHAALTSLRPALTQSVSWYLPPVSWPASPWPARAPPCVFH
jgi:hypothetical protein